MAFKAIPVTAAKVPATLTNFPVYIKPSAMSGWGSLTLAEAQSSRWYADEDKIVELPREVVAADEIHSLVDTFDSTSIIYTDYDGVRADYAVTDTYGRNAVWVDYLVVMHAEGGSTNATGGASTTDTSVTYATANGQVGQGGSYNGSSSRSTAANIGAASTGLTVSAWVKQDTTTIGTIVSRGGGSAATNSYYLLTYNDAGTMRAQLMLRSSSTYNYTTSSGAYNLATRSLVHGTYDKSNGKLYLNGSLTDTGAAFTQDIQTPSATFAVGDYAALRWDGDIDEIRVSGSARTANWITTEYNNQSDVATFWGTVTDAWGGGGTEYELVCDAGSFALTGIAAELTVSRSISTDPASFTLTGLDVLLSAERSIAADPASFALSGQDAALSFQTILSPAPGSFTLLGTETDLLRTLELAAGTGAFTFNGQDVSLPRSYGLSVSPGAFTLTGIDASLSAELQLSAAPGAFTLTGQEATLGRITVLDVETGTILVTGIDADLARRFGLQAGAGSFILSGIDADLLARINLEIETGSFVLTGIGIETELTNILNPYCPLPRPYTEASSPYTRTTSPYTQFPPGNCP